MMYYKIIVIFALLFLQSCTPVKCPEIKPYEGVGDMVKISMIECGTSDVVFDLEFKLNLIIEDNDSLRYKEYVHVDKKDINFKANRNFDYDIKVSRLYDKMFSVNIGIGIGDTIIIDGMDHMSLKESIPKSWSSSKTIVGPYVTLMLDGVMEENIEGTFQTKIAPTKLNSKALKFFNKNFAEFNKSYTLNLSIN